MVTTNTERFIAIVNHNQLFVSLPVFQDTKLASCIGKLLSSYKNLHWRLCMRLFHLKGQKSLEKPLTSVDTFSRLVKPKPWRTNPKHFPVIFSIMNMKKESVGDGQYKRLHFLYHSISPETKSSCLYRQCNCFAELYCTLQIAGSSRFPTDLLVSGNWTQIS